MSPESQGCPVDHAALGATAEKPAVPRWEGRVGQWSKVPGSARMAWGLNYGLSRFGFAMASRRGDPIARLTTDPVLRANPYPGYEDLRSRGRFVAGRFVTATVDHEVARSILRSPDFVTGGDAKPVQGRLTNAYYGLLDERHIGPIDQPSMLSVDGDLHLRYRRLVTRAFAARSVAQQEDQVREVSAQLLDSLEADGVRGFDLVERFAGQLPVAVIADMLGVHGADRDRLLAWGDGAAQLLDPDLTWRQYRSSIRDVRGLHDWFTDHVQHLRHRPDDSLLGRLVQLEGDDRLEEVELRAIGLLLLGAGFETTVNLISNAVALLDAHPEQRAAASQDGWSGAIEETLRYEPPVQLTFRAARTPTEIAGHRFEPGEGVLVMIAGANRDPAVFEDASTFDVRRENAGEHLSLSHGAHYCVGANLAKLEGRVALETLYGRFPELRVTDGAKRRPNRVLRGWERLPVAV